MRTLLAAAAAAATFALTGPAQAISFSIYNDLAGWQAGAGASTLQDFSTYAVDGSVQGATVLPGVTVSSNLPDLKVRSAAELKLFASGGSATGSRLAGNAYYEFDLGNAYRAFAFDVLDFELDPPVGGGAVGPGLVDVLFEDGFNLTYQVEADAAGSSRFFGVTSDTAITRVRWLEALERTNVNEETSIDNLRVALAVNRVPEPSSLLLAAGALALLARRRRG